LYGNADVLLADNTELTTLNCGTNSKITISLGTFANKNMRYVNANGGGVSGNLSSLSGKTSLTDLIVQDNPSVVGNISSLSDCTSLRTLMLSGTGATGDTSSLAGLTNLTTFTYTNTAITGTWPLT
jgi:hypothetical protein